MIGLQNAGKTSLLRVLAVSALATYWSQTRFTRAGALLKLSSQGGEFTVEYAFLFYSC